MNFKIQGDFRLFWFAMFFVIAIIVLLILSFFFVYAEENIASDIPSGSVSLLASNSITKNKMKNNQSTTSSLSSGSSCNTLSPEQRAVLIDKATEAPFSGRFDKHFDKGIYVCAACNAPLFLSSYKFNSGCGWPAFDDSLPNAVKPIPDADGVRSEIVCARCGGHLGHVFTGEGLTPKNLRHCVNSLSLDFIPAENIGTAIVAGGCFWGVEELMRKAAGVISVVSGYAGGVVKNPDYKSVCSGKTGHLEAVEVLFDNRKTSYSEVLKMFFEIHDFTQKNGQGADIGSQYKSAVLCLNSDQLCVAEGLVASLKARGYDVATAVRLIKDTDFYPAEDYHQRYYERKGGAPYCHFRRKIF